MGYAIRRAKAGDVDALVGIEEAAFADPGYSGMQMSRRSFAGHVAAGVNPLFVVVERGADGETVCGYALGLVRRDSPYVRFLSLAIRPEEAGKGAGKLLFQAIEAFARDNGNRGVRLEIREDNERLFRRYESIGYRVFRRVPDYYADGCAAIRMVRDVASPG